MVDAPSGSAGAPNPERADADSEAPGTRQHALNNLLAALLAEAQVLSFDPMLPEAQRASVERIVFLIRRVIAAVQPSSGSGAGRSAAQREPRESSESGRLADASAANPRPDAAR